MSWKQPFTWKGSGRYVKTIRRFRVPAVTRLAQSNRPAALAIVVLAILVMAVPFVMRPVLSSSKGPALSSSKGSPSVTVEGTQTLAHSEPTYVAVPREAKRATRSTPSIPSEEPRAEVVAAVSTLVTVTGCLERSDEAFRLKDTSGADAPRTRSWKTGFLNKRSTSM